MMSRLTLQDFRNFASLDLAVSPGLTILHGANAQGKTNLLEAMHLVSTTRLLRGTREGEAVREGAALARVEATLAESGTELAIAIGAGKRKVGQLNRQSLPRAADLIGRLPTLSVSLADMAIVRGEPNDRRLFLDLELCQLYPAYLNELALFKRALDQRNALLRRAREEPVGAEEFEPWEEAMAQHGASIREHRRKLVEVLAAPASDVHRRFGSGEALAVGYETKDVAEGASELLKELALARGREIARGSSLVGPHRDDLGLFIEGRDARSFGSQGQQRTAVLSLKLAAHQNQAESRGVPPLLLLDDMLSDLDAIRRTMLIEWILENAGQAVLTCTEPSAAGPTLLGRAQLIEVKSGQVRPSTVQ